MLIIISPNTKRLVSCGEVSACIMVVFLSSCVLRVWRFTCILFYFYLVIFLACQAHGKAVGISFAHNKVVDVNKIGRQHQGMGRCGVCLIS